MPRIASANPYNIRPGEISPWRDLSSQADHIDNRNRGLAAWAPRIATAAVGGYLGAAAAPFLLGGGAGAAGAASAGQAAGGAAGAAGAGGGMAGFLGHPLTQLAGTGLFGWLQQRSGNRANDQAMQQQLAFADRQMQLEQARLAQEREDMLAMREEERRRWEADEAYRQAMLAQSNEQNAYTRNQQEFERSILEEREGRRRQFDPYRQMALARLGQFFG